MKTLRKNMVIHFKARDEYETITKASNDRINGEVITDKNDYSTDYISRWYDFGFITIYTAKEFKDLNLVNSN